MALTYTPDAEIGSMCPEFQLKGVDGKMWKRDDFAGSKAFLIMFICNHCPYVKAVEDRLIALGREMKDRGVKIAAVSSNDAENYPDDSFANLAKRAQEKNYPFPYLYDETQAVARTFGAVCTPDFFLYDAQMKLAYRGRLDDSWKDPSQVKHQELRDAIVALLENRKPSDAQKPSMGCNIKWKKNA
jgi:peroxiredoxin